jgi:hypothetical protein
MLMMTYFIIIRLGIQDPQTAILQPIQKWRIIISRSRSVNTQLIQLKR